MASLMGRDETGRYVMMDSIEKHIPELDHDLAESAKKARADIIVVSAIDILVDPAEIGHFKHPVYPIEIVSRVLKRKDYQVLERCFMNHPYIGIDPKTRARCVLNPLNEAQMQLNCALETVLGFYNENPEKVMELRSRWN